jgi:hypothetical protein
MFLTPTYRTGKIARSGGVAFLHGRSQGNHPQISQIYADFQFIGAHFSPKTH